MDEELDVIVTGFDVADRQAEAGLVRVFGLDQQRAHRFLRELPAVAKRCPNQASADRYVHALRSIGARVELQAVSKLRPSDSAALRPTHSSLPIPAPSVMARLHESMRVERETQRAIRLFRKAEGLDQTETFEPVAVDPVNPSIPKAPKVPHDLHRMPNAKLARPSERPIWSVPPSEGRDSRHPSRPHADAKLPPPPIASEAPPRASESPPDFEEPVDPLDARTADSMLPQDVGLAHAATASMRPGLTSLIAWQQQRDARLRGDPRTRWVMAALALVLVYGALRLSGLLDSEADRRTKAWATQGFETGEHAEAQAWLQDSTHTLRGFEPGAARELVDRLERAGARGVYAARIQSTPNGESSSALVIDLPNDKAKREVILWHAAKARGLEPPLIPDHGEPYYLLTWQ
jgi:hypothetical protein